METQFLLFQIDNQLIKFSFKEFKKNGIFTFKQFLHM